MPQVKRTPVAVTDDWRQRELPTGSPEQRVYESLRPIALFGRSPSVSARDIGTPQRTPYRQADAFDRAGLASPLPPPLPARHHARPDGRHQAIRALKAERPPRNLRESATSYDLRFGRSLSYHTVKRVLVEAAAMPAASRRFPRHRQIADPAERRRAISRLHSEGWNKMSAGAGHLAIHLFLTDRCQGKGDTSPPLGRNPARYGGKVCVAGCTHLPVKASERSVP